MEPEQYEKQYLYRRVVQAKLFIDRQFAEHIDLGQISSQASFSRFHFIRLFKELYGRTPHQYLTKVRLDHAQVLLDRDLPVAEAAFIAGFESPTSFAALFKKHIGLTPSAYQAKRLQLKNRLASNPLHGVPNCFAETHGWKNSNIR